METIGQRIEAIASECGLPSNSALAQHLGITYETLRKWRSGSSAPNRSRLKKISELLGVDPARLMFGIEREAGAKPEDELSEEESRVLAAFRTLPTRERMDFLAQIEEKAAVVTELLIRLRQQSK